MRRFVICAVALFMAIGVASAQETITRDDIKSSVTAYAWQQYEVGNDAFVAPLSHLLRPSGRYPMCQV